MHSINPRRLHSDGRECPRDKETTVGVDQPALHHTLNTEIRYISTAYIQNATQRNVQKHPKLTKFTQMSNKQIQTYVNKIKTILRKLGFLPIYIYVSLISILK